MKFKSAVQKIVVPALRQHDFLLKEAQPGHYEFVHEPEYMRIILDISPLSGGVRFYYDADYHFAPSDFEQEWYDSVVGACYHTQEELEKTLYLFLEFTETMALPFMRKLLLPAPELTQEMYTMLSRNTSELAKEFSSRYGLSMQYSAENMSVLEHLLNEWRGDDCEQRKVRFDENVGQIINMAAYLGEIVRVDKGEGKWVWDVWEPPPKFELPDLSFLKTEEDWAKLSKKHRIMFENHIKFQKDVADGKVQLPPEPEPPEVFPYYVMYDEGKVKGGAKIQLKFHPLWDLYAYWRYTPELSSRHGLITRWRYWQKLKWPQ